MIQKFLGATHWHSDHSGNNAWFRAQGAEVVAHANGRRRLGGNETLEGRRTAPEDVARQMLPTVTFDGTISLHANGETIRLEHVGAGHTDGDVVVWFEGSKVVHLGDCLFEGRFPYVDLSSGDDPEGLLATIEHVLERIDGEWKVVPGHGSVTDAAGLGAYRDMLAGCIRDVRQAMEGGASLADAEANELLRSYDERWGQGSIKLGPSRKMLFEALGESRELKGTGNRSVSGGPRSRRAGRAEGPHPTPSPRPHGGPRAMSQQRPASSAAALARALASVALIGALPSVAGAQSASVHALLKSGDTLENDETVVGFLRHDVSRSGRWAAIVGTTGGYPFQLSLVVDGAILMTEGAPIPGGETVAQIRDVAVSRDGALGVLYDVENATFPTNPLGRLRIGPHTVLVEGDSLSVGNLTPQDEIEWIDDFDLDGQHLIVALRTITDTGIRKHALVRGVLGGGGFTPTSALVEGDAVTGLSAPFQSSRGDLDIADSGASAANANVDTPGTSTQAGIFDGQGIAETNGAGPAPNSTWTFLASPRVRVNRGGEYAIGGTLELANGLERGVLYRGTVPIVAEGGGLNGVAGAIVGPFTTPAFELTDHGEVVFTVPFTSGAERLMIGATTLVDTATDTIDGESIASLRAGEYGKFLSAAHDGDTVLVTADLAVSGPALLIVERDIVEPTNCMAAANSTKAVGSLHAEGSRHIEFDDLTITAADLPMNAFGYLLTSRTEGFVANPGGSAGNLCITGSIGRFIAQTASSGATGTILTDVHPQSLPQPTGDVSAVHGETWTFQLWHRDSSMGAATSNFTDSISITFQ